MPLALTRCQGQGTIRLVLHPKLSKFALISIACTLALGVTDCTKARKQEAATVIELPTLEIQELTHDFGEVVEGGKLTHLFTVRNAGAGVLHINELRVSCGCTAAVLKANDVAPGGEGQIEVTFDTNHLHGDQGKTVVVTSNDPIHPNAYLGIRANVQALLALQPEFIQMNSEPGKTQVIDTWLTGKMKEQARLKVLKKPSDPELVVKVIEQTTDGGVALQGLRFTLSSRKSGFGSAGVIMETGLPNPDELQIDYSWTVAGNIEVSPAHLLFTNAKGGTSERVLRVKSRKADFKLRQARIVSGPFVAKIDTLDSGAGYDVRISFKKGAAPTATVATDLGKLELLSNDPLEPKREVRIRFSP